MPQSEWIFYKIGLGHFHGAMDHVVSQKLPPLMEQVDANRWFFLRYFDEEDGLHLRLRLQVAADRREAVRQQVGAELHRMLTELALLPTNPYAPLIQGMDYVIPTRVLSVKPATYEPELDKFGGPLGISDAEDVFHASSLIAAQALQLEASQGLSRKTLAPCFMATVLEVQPIGMPPAQFLRSYAMDWLPGEPSRSQSLREEFFAKAAELLEAGIPIVAGATLPEAGRALVQQWRAAQTRAAACYRRYQHVPEDFAATQAWQWLHLMNNRLGFSPFEEAYLATLLEAHYLDQRHAA